MTSKPRMRWVRASTRQKGWSMHRLVYRGCVVGRVESFGYGVYGNVLGKRTGSLSADVRKAKRIVRKRVIQSIDEPLISRLLEAIRA